MNKDTVIKELLYDIKNTIQSFHEGGLSLNDCKKKYSLLYNRYSELEKTCHAGRDSGFFKGILYHHNVHNFTKLSALLKKSGQEIQFVEHYGNSQLKQIMIQNIASAPESFAPDRYTVIKLNEKDGLTYNLHVYMISISQEIYYIAAISSSFFFNGDLFSLYCKIISEMLSSTVQYMNPLDMDYIGFIGYNISDYLRDIPDDHLIEADIFYFRGLIENFSHLGTSIFYEISELILNELKAAYPEETNVFILSISNYIVIRHSPESAHSIPPVKIQYKNTLVPFESIKFIIENPESVYKLLEDIYIFENYVNQGEFFT